MLEAITLDAMSSGEVTGRHFLTGEPIQLTWQDGVFREKKAVIQAPELWIAPGLVDLQVNGYAGVDFQQDGLRAEDLLRAVRELAKGCCTSFS